MVPVGNYAKFLSSVNHTTKTIHHHQILKHFTRSKKLAALRRLFILPLDKTFLRLWKKHFYGYLQKYKRHFVFRMLRECSSWAFRNGVVQMFFLTPTRNILGGKFAKRVMFFGCLAGVCFYNVEWVEVPKMSEVLYCKISDFFF